MSQQTSSTPAPAPQDENQLIAERREKLKALRAAQAQGKNWHLYYLGRSGATMGFPSQPQPALT